MSEEMGDNSGGQLVRKKGITDEERAELCSRLDQELEDFIDGLEKKRYTEGWPEDRWEEEMDKHPFFMKEPPKEGDELHPLLEGMRQLKYDPMENTVEDLATTYKEDGNFNMKYKKYRMAIFSYTEGINQKCQNDEVNATLYNNRSAANYFLKNYRTSLADAEKALSLKPDYEKAEMRVAQCLLHLKRYEACLDACSEYADKYGTNDALTKLRTKARNEHMQVLRDERERTAVERKKSEAITRTEAELHSRGVRFEEALGKTRLRNILRPTYVPLEDFPIHLNKMGDGLVWPAVFCYPEFEICDFQQELEDNVLMCDILADLFVERMECDSTYSYRPNTVNVYSEDTFTAKVHLIDIKESIKQITSNKNFVVSKGVLTFYVLVKDSTAEKQFLAKPRRPLLITRTPFDP